MKFKILSAFLFLFFTVSFSYAQSFKGGILFGLIGSQVEGDNMSGFHKGGISAGFFTNRNINDKWMWQLEMKYIQKGSKSNNRINPLDSLANLSTTASIYYKMKLDYIEIPLLFRYRNKKFVYEFGPSLNTIIVAKIYDNYGEIPPASLDSPQSNPFNRLEGSANIGIGRFLTDNLFLNWRFSTSITPIRPFYQNATYRFNRGQYNTLMEFSLRYQFKGKEKTETDAK